MTTKREWDAFWLGIIAMGFLLTGYRERFDEIVRPVIAEGERRGWRK